MVWPCFAQDVTRSNQDTGWGCASQLGLGPLLSSLLVGRTRFPMAAGPRSPFSHFPTSAVHSMDICFLLSQQFVSMTSPSATNWRRLSALKEAGVISWGPQEQSLYLNTLLTRDVSICFQTAKQLTSPCKVVRAENRSKVYCTTYESLSFTFCSVNLLFQPCVSYKWKIFKNDTSWNFQWRIFLVNFMQILSLIIQATYRLVSQKMMVL